MNHIIPYSTTEAIEAIKIAKRAVLVAQRDLARAEHDAKHIALNAEVDRLSKAHSALQEKYKAQYAEYSVAFEISTDPATRTSDNIERTRALHLIHRELETQLEDAWNAYSKVAKDRQRSWGTFRRSQSRLSNKILALS